MILLMTRFQIEMDYFVTITVQRKQNLLTQDHHDRCSPVLASLAWNLLLVDIHPQVEQQLGHV